MNYIQSEPSDISINGDSMREFKRETRRNIIHNYDSCVDIVKTLCIKSPTNSTCNAISISSLCHECGINDDIYRKIWQLENYDISVIISDSDDMNKLCVTNKYYTLWDEARAMTELIIAFFTSNSINKQRMVDVHFFNRKSVLNLSCYQPIFFSKKHNSLYKMDNAFKIKPSSKQNTVRFRNKMSSDPILYIVLCSQADIQNITPLATFFRKMKIKSRDDITIVSMDSTISSITNDLRNITAIALENPDMSFSKKNPYYSPSYPVVKSSLANSYCDITLVEYLLRIMIRPIDPWFENMKPLISLQNKKSIANNNYKKNNLMCSVL